MTVLNYGNADPCLSKPCDEVCISTSENTYYCDYYTGFHLYNENSCQGKLILTDSCAVDFSLANISYLIIFKAA